MLKIRNKQMEAFERADAPHFEPRTIRHLKEAFPKHCEFLGEDGIRTVVRYGVQQASAYGLTNQSGVGLFIDLMLLLGRGFDTDSQLPWATEILNDESRADQNERADNLFEKATEYLDRVSGPSNEFIDEAQRRILYASIEPPSHNARFEDEVSSRLQNIWPQKHAYLGEAGARRLIRQGIEAAKGYGITDESGFLVYIGLMYMLGSSFDTDPLFAWASAILNDEEDQAGKVGRLYFEAINYLKQWCA